jgi:hypothetical protein
LNAKRDHQTLVILIRGQVHRRRRFGGKRQHRGRGHGDLKPHRVLAAKDISVDQAARGTMLATIPLYSLK